MLAVHSCARSLASLSHVVSRVAGYVRPESDVHAARAGEKSTAHELVESTLMLCTVLLAWSQMQLACATSVMVAAAADVCGQSRLRGMLRSVYSHMIYIYIYHIL